MLTVYQDRIGEICIEAGRWMFFLFLAFNAGGYMGGKEHYFGVFMPELEVVFPLSGFGVLIVFLGVFLRKKQYFVSWQQYTFLLFLLACFVLQALFSFDPNMSILFFPLFILGVLGTVLGDEIRLTASKNVIPLLFGVGLGFLIFLFGNKDVTPVLSLMILFAWVSVLRGGIWPTKNIDYFSLVVLVLLFLLQSLLGLILLSVLLFGAPLWMGRRKKKERMFQIILSVMTAIAVISGFLGGYFYFPELQEWSIGFFDQFLFGTGIGQYLPYLQHQADVFLSLSDFVLPSTGIMLWWKEWGAIGIVFILLLLVWNRKWGKMPLVYLFIISAYFFFSAKGITQEVFLLFGLLTMLQRGNRLKS